MPLEGFVDCCHGNGLTQEFDRAQAQRDVKAYLAKGLDMDNRVMRDALLAQGVSGASILEIGCSVGVLHLELLRAGAARATGVDASPAAIEAARALAAQLGLQERTEHHVMDFAEGTERLPEADIVVLVSVLCCYPHMRELVTLSARHARRLYALAYPRVNWATRLWAGGYNVFMKLRRREFRLFLHPPEEVFRTVTALGFSPLFSRTFGPYNIGRLELFQRG